MPAADLLCPEQLLSRFNALDGLLQTHQHLWRPAPFTQLQLDWEMQHPELAKWLRGRSLEQAESAHNQPHLLVAPQPFPALAHAAATLSHTARLSPRAAVVSDPRLSVAVPGRKWQQLQAFGECLEFQQQPKHWLDWCAGKGHLGRYLANDTSQLTCVERDPELVRNGQQLSEKRQISARHIELDVMHDQAAQLLNASHTAVALHACGDLHVRLLQLASAAGCRQISIAPCCYNRTQHQQYQALSSAAGKSALQLSRQDLRLVQCETVTAGQRVRRQRDQSMAWRLGFDLLQRELRGLDEYLPTPPLAAAWLQKPFVEYCAELARLNQLEPGHKQEWARLETAGWQRLANVRNLELVRDLFRRPMEVWLLLDRALYLQEQGYQVRTGSFCESELTPRNLMLLAERVENSQRPVDNSVD